MFKTQINRSVVSHVTKTTDILYLEVAGTVSRFYTSYSTGMIENNLILADENAAIKIVVEYGIWAEP